MPIVKRDGAKENEAELRVDIESYLKQFLAEREQSEQAILTEKIVTVIYDKKLDEGSIYKDQKEIDFEQNKLVNRIIERVLRGIR